MKRKWFIFYGICLAFGLFFLAGCGRSLDGGQGEPVEYVICEAGHLPKQLKEMIEEKKKSACTFSFQNSRYQYIVVCYGKKTYSGYSIQVEHFYEAEDVLYVKTKLIGPSKSEAVVEVISEPYIVLRCSKKDMFCVIKP